MARNNANKIHRTFLYEVKRKSITRGMVSVATVICDDEIDAINDYINTCKVNGKSVPTKRDLTATIVARVVMTPPVGEFNKWCVANGYFHTEDYTPDSATTAEEDF